MDDLLDEYEDQIDAVDDPQITTLFDILRRMMVETERRLDDRLDTLDADVACLGDCLDEHIDGE